MFGYIVPSYSKILPQDLSRYRRYYCEGCHQLRDGFGLQGTLTVSYDMTFNTILLAGIMGEGIDFEGTSRRICVLDHSKSGSAMMEKMAAYTLILTKWELYDDETDKPSLKTKLISAGLGKAIEKASKLYPEYDEAVGKGFRNLRSLELDGCRDARLMGTGFGKGLSEPLRDIAGDYARPELDTVFEELTAAVYIMDAVDDLNDDFMDGTYNPFLPESGFVNAGKFINSNIYEFTDIFGTTIGNLQDAYGKIRPGMKGNVSLCDNIVLHGIPESARKVLSGDARAKASVKNILSNRRERTSKSS